MTLRPAEGELAPIMIDMRVHFSDPVPPGRPLLIAPRLLDAFGYAFDSLAVENGEIEAEIGARNAPQRAFVIRATRPPLRPILRYAIAPYDGPPPDWIWSPPDTRYVRASPELAAFARRLAADSDGPAQTLRRIVDHASEVLWYGHGPGTVLGDSDSVPLLTRPTRGTCIDMHGYCVAAARAVGIEAAYCAGFWFAKGADRAPGMHCWFSARIDGAIVHYDVSHQLKVPRLPVVEGLDPIPGIRFLAASGKGFEFDLPGRALAVDHFARFVWRTEDGCDHYPAHELRLDAAVSETAASGPAC
ncbi:MAG: transglutaminase-like domain-containing protein [Tagaea sp.]|nr:transglutaminase-like domain-containing protein [Tagaea sp.]